MTAPTLHGRDAELARLRALLDAARGGTGCAVLVHGPAGAGKSALLAALREGLTGARVLEATGTEAEADLPFAGLDALLRPVLDLRDRLPAVQAASLEAAFALGPGLPGQAYAVGAATLSLLAAGAEREPVVCLVDDAQWLDPASLAALSFAARRLGDEPIALVFASRDDAAVNVERMSLAPLSASAARSVLSELSGRLAPEVADEIVAAAEGNPLVLRELAGRVDRAVLEGGDALVGPLPPHGRAEALFAERVDGLSEPARWGLLVAATSGDGDARLLDDAAALDALEEAEEAGVVSLRPGRIEFVHPVVRSVAYHRGTPAERRRAHAAVAAALPPTDRRRPWHLASSATRPDEAIAAQLVAGADDARRRGGYGSAARALRRAADLTPEPEARARRLLDAGDDFDMAGLTEDAVEAVERAAGLEDVSPITASRIRGHRGHLMLVQGRPRQARELLLPEAEALSDERPVSAARYFIEASFACMEMDDVAGWYAHSERALAVLGARDRSTWRVALAMHTAAHLAVHGNPDDPTLDEALEMIDELLASDEPVVGAIEVYAVLAHALLGVSRTDVAERLLDHLAAGGRAMHALGMLPYVLGVRGLLRFRTGRWALSAADAGEAVELAELTGRRSFLTAALGLQAIVEAWQGDRDACREHAERAIGLASGTGARLAVPAHYALGCDAHAAGDLERAAEHLREAAAFHTSARFVPAGSDLCEPDLVEVLIRLGDPGAEPALAVWEQRADASGQPVAIAAALRCRGLLAPDAELDGVFTAALARLDGVAAPLDRARILLCHGERLRRAKRRADARAPLREALEGFERLGAAPWAARARKELRATGGMVPTRTRPELQELTPHEVQVALMVAEGRTNREVAAALFLAPKTIEHHLSTIFRKLDVKRRGELARLFATELGGERLSAQEPVAERG